MLTYAIIPARSGSKGVINKNIRTLNHRPLLAYSINLAKALNVDKILCSTDSKEYASIAKEWGAEVPFLRSEEASADHAMEQDILKDLDAKFEEYDIPKPDILVWLRPTFVFRDMNAILDGIQLLRANPSYSSVRTVVETEARLYHVSDTKALTPAFDDKGKSMIRRQDIGTFYKVYSTDIFRFSKENLGDDFLGSNVIGIPVNKICGLDIDDEIDFKLVEALVTNAKYLVDEYLFED